MAAHREAVVGVTPGLEPWQFYGPSTRRDGRVYCIALAKPYESITVRGLPTKRVKAVTALGTDTDARRSEPTPRSWSAFMPDPTGEMIVSVPADVIDEYATVIAIDIEGDF